MTIRLKVEPLARVDSKVSSNYRRDFGNWIPLTWVRCSLHTTLQHTVRLTECYDQVPIIEVGLINGRNNAARTGGEFIGPEALARATICMA
jgi:hypothetical protein